MLEGFLKVEGIDGECKDASHKGWIDVTGLSWGVSNQAAPSDDGSLEAGTPEVQSVSFSQQYNRASIGLFLACATGREIASMIFEGVARDGDSRPVLLRITIKDCLVTKVATSSTAANVMERVEVVFRSIDMQAQERPH